jgi:hypothetical protein
VRSHRWRVYENWDGDFTRLDEVAAVPDRRVLGQERRRMLPFDKSRNRFKDGKQLLLCCLQDDHLPITPMYAVPKMAAAHIRLRNIDGIAKFNHAYTIKCQGFPPADFTSRRQSSCLLSGSKVNFFSGALIAIAPVHVPHFCTTQPYCRGAAIPRVYG